MRDFPIRATDVRPGAVVRRGTRVVVRTPRDLIAVVGFVALSVVALAMVDVSSTLVRSAIGFPLLFFAPGYVVVSVLFPRRIPVGSPEAAGRLRLVQTRAVSDVERAALSFGLSIVVLPLLALAIAPSPWGYDGATVVGVVGAFVLVGAALATARRLRVPGAVRYRVEFRRHLEAVAAAFDSDSSAEVAVNVALVVSILIAVSTVGFALVSPQEGERYTNLQLLAENESDELEAGAFPAETTVGEPEELVVAVDNEERERTSYEIVVVLERVDERGGDLTVVERVELERFEATIEDGERWTHRHEVVPEMVGDDLRVSYYLYRDGAAPDPDEGSSYRHVYFWTDVTADGGEDSV